MKPNRQAVHSKYKGHCAYCGCEIAIKDMQVDHVIPQHHVPKYATHEAVHCHENHMPACRSCNNYKSGNPLEVFRKMIQNQIEVLRRDRPTFRLAERYGLIECKPKPVVFYFETL
jgi:5-methylcytosine-specific restriction endonuclease McrA